MACEAILLSMVHLVWALDVTGSWEGCNLCARVQSLSLALWLACMPWGTQRGRGQGSAATTRIGSLTAPLSAPGALKSSKSRLWDFFVTWPKNIHNPCSREYHFSTLRESMCWERGEMEGCDCWLPDSMGSGRRLFFSLSLFGTIT